MFQQISPLLNWPVTGTLSPVMNFFPAKLIVPAVVKLTVGSGWRTPTLSCPYTDTTLLVLCRLPIEICPAALTVISDSPSTLSSKLLDVFTPCESKLMVLLLLVKCKPLSKVSTSPLLSNLTVP